MQGLLSVGMLPACRQWRVVAFEGCSARAPRHPQYPAGCRVRQQAQQPELAQLPVGGVPC